MPQPSGFSRLSATILTLSLVLTGCGEGSSSSGSSAASGSDATGDSSLPDTDGTIAYDFSLRGTEDNPRVYRRNLQSRSLGVVQSDDSVGGQVFAGGVYEDDLFAPAVVTASPDAVSIHSRVTGESAELWDLGKGQEPCSVRGFANSDLASGLVYVEMSGGNLTCDTSVDSDDNTYWVKFENGKVDRWEADGKSTYSHVYFNGEGNIDLISAHNHADKTVTLYDESGRVLQRLEGSTRKPEIYPMAAPGLTHDDTYVGVLNDDRFLATTVSMLVNSGLSGAKPLLTGLSRNARLASRSLIEDDRYAVIDDGGVLHKVDQINRSASVLADFSQKYDNGWVIDEVFLVGRKAIVLSSTYDDVDRLVSTSEAHSIDLASGEVTLLLAEDSAFRAARTDSLLFINYLNSELRYRTLMIQAAAEPLVTAVETYYATAQNLARGGDRSKVFALTSDEPKAIDSPVALLNPEIWEVNEDTGSYLGAVTKLQYNCQSMDALYAINSHVSVFSFCDDGFALQELELERGWLSFVTSDYRTVN
ncbi:MULTISPECIES: hypothetical protein [Marinobacter]|uniref:hypothetical protein n=1 Tax=Marinobacter TaxID=2742 RepID=UPI0012442667|nr:MULTISPECIES: hypothetical protein [Marinobacter]MBL3556684.1 hypothetical protein [Marinobacter sp. JB05H06]